MVATLVLLTKKVEGTYTVCLIYGYLKDREPWRDLIGLSLAAAKKRMEVNGWKDVTSSHTNHPIHWNRAVKDYDKFFMELRSA